MARIRMIKPEFFDDPDVGDIPVLSRLFFLGLLTQADRRGRLKDDPKRLRARILPYDVVDADALLETLADSGFIVRYLVDGRPFIQIRSFEKHQRPHPKEAESEIPPAPDYTEVQSAIDSARTNAKFGGVYAIRVGDKIKVGHSRDLSVRTRELVGMLPNAELLWAIEGLNKQEAAFAERSIHQLFHAQHVDAEWFLCDDTTGRCPIGSIGMGREKDMSGSEKVVACTPESGSLESGSLDSGTRKLEASAPTHGADERDWQFDRFWSAYPAKKGKKAAWQEWRKLRPSDAMGELIIAAVKTQVQWDDWLRDGGKYIPNPSTWLHQGRWDDEPKHIARVAAAQSFSAAEVIHAKRVRDSVGGCTHEPRCPTFQDCLNEIMLGIREGAA